MPGRAPIDVYKRQRIYNGVADHYLTNKIEQDTLTEKLESIKKDYPKTIMCISRISKQKKFDLFLDIAQKMPQYAFVWIGNKEEIEGLPPNVFCLGEMHSAFTYLRYADVFVLPSNYEGLPCLLYTSLYRPKPVTREESSVSLLVSETEGDRMR